ncbi:centromere protein O-like [Pomacea canaliculata]|uniref:centromere protein O-like n=1 Tax=Pomacea canaliculata TaxID=400727 RepID=UPI000D738D95|nr:centromere protein O-like [Pomacea canaliculata]
MLGSLSALGSLQSAATAKQQSEKEVAIKQQIKQAQLQRIEELKKKREKLKELLQTAAAEADELHAVEENGSGSELRRAEAYCKKLREQLNVYKLTGVAITESDHVSKLLCFTTSFKGIYLESYHVKLQRLSSGHFKIAHHDLPAFIVFSKLPENLEVKDLQSFVQPVRELLAMYIIRREEVKQAETKFSSVLYVAEKSGPVDFLCFRLDIQPNLQAEITLKYADLCTATPTTVTVVPVKKGNLVHQKGLPDSVSLELQHVFSENRLTAAIGLALELLVAHFRNQTEASIT